GESSKYGPLSPLNTWSLDMCTMRTPAGACFSNSRVPSTFTECAKSGESSQVPTSHTPAQLMIMRGASRTNNAATASSSSRSMPRVMSAGGSRVEALQNAVTSDLPARRIDHPSMEVAPNRYTPDIGPSLAQRQPKLPQLGLAKWQFVAQEE